MTMADDQTLTENRSKWIHGEIMTFLRENRRRDLQQMRRDGKLEEYLQLMIGVVHDDAMSRVSRGEYRDRAYRLALRTRVFGMEED